MASLHNIANVMTIHLYTDKTTQTYVFFATDRIFSGSGSQFTAPCIKLYPYIILRLYSLYTMNLA